MEGTSIATSMDYGVTMPTYSFRDKTTGEEFDVFMSISELDQFLVEHPDYEKDRKSTRLNSSH